MNNIDEILSGLPKLVDKFPNGISNYLETHYLIVQSIEYEINNSTNLCKTLEENLGIGQLWILAEQLTDKFEHMYRGIEWGINDDVQYFDAIDKFLNEELYGKE